MAMAADIPVTEIKLQADPQQKTDFAFKEMQRGGKQKP
jgi:hypothetical protein